MLKKLIIKVKLLIQKLTILSKTNSKINLILILIFFAFILQFYCNYDSDQIQKLYEMTIILKTVDLLVSSNTYSSIYPDLLIVGDFKIFSLIFEIKASLCLIYKFFFLIKVSKISIIILFISYSLIFLIILNYCQFILFRIFLKFQFIFFKKNIKMLGFILIIFELFFLFIKKIKNTFIYFIPNNFFILFFFIYKLISLVFKFFLIYNFKIFLVRFALPFRIFIRSYYLFGCFFKAIVLLHIQDFLNFFINIINLILSGSILLYFKRSSLIFIFLFFLVNFDKIFLIFNFQNYQLLSFIIEILEFYSNFQFYENPIVYSLLFIIILLDIGSMYYMTSVAKRLFFSIYFLIFFLIFLTYLVLPDYSIYSIFLIKLNGFLLIYLFIFRALREDFKFYNKIGWDPFSNNYEHLSFLVKKNISIIYRFFDKVYNVYLEHIYFLIIVFYFYLFIYDSNSIIFFENKNLFFWIPNSKYCQFFILIFLLIRQSTYSYFIWFFFYFYIFAWSIISIYLLSSTGFSYFGILTMSNFSEFSAIGNLGLISSIFGLENIMLFGNYSSYSWFYGENFLFKIINSPLELKFDLHQFANTPFSIFGDMYIPPYLATPNDDHNWVIANTLEKNYFDSVKLQKSASDSLISGVSNYWMVERYLHTMFGEFLENDLYYGWSHSVLIDTETYFDYSPYGITNLIGDGLIKNIVTDIFSIFVGPSELDESSLLNLNDWGLNYAAGSTSNRVSGGESSGLENSSNLTKDQKIRENGESFSEWFPGLYVLDGRFDSKFYITNLRIFLFIAIPVITISIWFTILGKPSNYFDESFGEMEFTNYNFYFFGNEQCETFTTYYWNPIYNSIFEWPNDDYSNDPIAYEPTNNLFEDLFKNVQSGLFNYTVLDSFFNLPILKHTEGFSSQGYKNFVMPLIFPTGVDFKTAKIINFSNFYSNLNKIAEKKNINPDSVYDSYKNLELSKKNKLKTVKSNVSLKKNLAILNLFFNPRFNKIKTVGNGGSGNLKIINSYKKNLKYTYNNKNSYNIDNCVDKLNFIKYKDIQKSNDIFFIYLNKNEKKIIIDYFKKIKNMYLFLNSSSGIFSKKNKLLYQKDEALEIKNQIESTVNNDLIFYKEFAEEGLRLKSNPVTFEICLELWWYDRYSEFFFLKINKNEIPIFNYNYDIKYTIRKMVVFKNKIFIDFKKELNYFKNIIFIQDIDTSNFLNNNYPLFLLENKLIVKKHNICTNLLYLGTLTIWKNPVFFNNSIIPYINNSHIIDTFNKKKSIDGDVKFFFNFNLKNLIKNNFVIVKKLKFLTKIKTTLIAEKAKKQTSILKHENYLKLLNFNNIFNKPILEKYKISNYKYSENYKLKKNNNLKYYSVNYGFEKTNDLLFLKNIFPKLLKNLKFKKNKKKIILLKYENTDILNFIKITNHNKYQYSVKKPNYEKYLKKGFWEFYNNNKFEKSNYLKSNQLSFYKNYNLINSVLSNYKITDNFKTSTRIEFLFNKNLLKFFNFENDKIREGYFTDNVKNSNLIKNNLPNYYKKKKQLIFFNNFFFIHKFLYNSYYRISLNKSFSNIIIFNKNRFKNKNIESHDFKKINFVIHFIKVVDKFSKLKKLYYCKFKKIIFFFNSVIYFILYFSIYDVFNYKLKKYISFQNLSNCSKKLINFDLYSLKKLNKQFHIYIYENYLKSIKISEYGLKNNIKKLFIIKELLKIFRFFFINNKKLKYLYCLFNMVKCNFNILINYLNLFFYKKIKNYKKNQINFIIYYFYKNYKLINIDNIVENLTNCKKVHLMFIYNFLKFIISFSFLKLNFLNNFIYFNSYLFNILITIKKLKKKINLQFIYLIFHLKFKIKYVLKINLKKKKITLFNYYFKYLNFNIKFLLKNKIRKFILDYSFFNKNIFKYNNFINYKYFKICAFIHFKNILNKKIIIFSLNFLIFNKIYFFNKLNFFIKKINNLFIMQNIKIIKYVELLSNYHSIFKKKYKKYIKMYFNSLIFSNFIFKIKTLKILLSYNFNIYKPNFYFFKYWKNFLDLKKLNIIKFNLFIENDKFKKIRISYNISSNSIFWFNYLELNFFIFMKINHFIKIISIISNNYLSFNIYKSKFFNLNLICIYKKYFYYEKKLLYYLFKFKSRNFLNKNLVVKKHLENIKVIKKYKKYFNFNKSIEVFDLELKNNLNIDNKFKNIENFNIIKTNTANLNNTQNIFTFFGNDVLIKEQWHNGFSNKIPVKNNSEIISNSAKSNIDLNLYLPNIDGNVFLANEIAYELNFEYNTLFESLIKELLSPDSNKYDGLEYEYEDTNPDYSTITEFADPDQNYAESELFENDTIIDDPRSFEFTEDTDRGWMFRKIESYQQEWDSNASLAKLEDTIFESKIDRIDSLRRKGNEFTSKLIPWSESNESMELGLSNFSSFSQNTNIFNKIENLKNIVTNQSINTRSVHWLDSMNHSNQINAKKYVNDKNNYFLQVMGLFKYRIRNIPIKNIIKEKISNIYKYSIEKSKNLNNVRFLKKYEYIKKKFRWFENFVYESVRIAKAQDGNLKYKKYLIKFWYSYINIKLVFDIDKKILKSNFGMFSLKNNLKIFFKKKIINFKRITLFLLLKTFIFKNKYRNFFLNCNLKFFIFNLFVKYKNFKFFSIINNFENNVKLIPTTFNFYLKRLSFFDKKFLIINKLINILCINYNFIRLNLIVLKKYIKVSKNNNNKLLTIFTSFRLNFLRKSFIFLKKHKFCNLKLIKILIKNKTIIKKYISKKTENFIFLNKKLNIKKNNILIYKKRIKNYNFRIKNYNNIFKFTVNSTIGLISQKLKKISLYLNKKLKLKKIYNLNYSYRTLNKKNELEFNQFLNSLTILINLLIYNKNYIFYDVSKFLFYKYLEYFSILDILLQNKNFSLSTNSIYRFYYIFKKLKNFTNIYISKFLKISNFIVNFNNFDNFLKHLKFSTIFDNILISIVFIIKKNIKISNKFLEIFIKIKKYLNKFHYKSNIFYLNSSLISLHFPKKKIFNIIEKYLEYNNNYSNYAKKIVLISCFSSDIQKYKNIKKSLNCSKSLFFNYKKIKKIYLFLNKIKNILIVLVNLFFKLKKLKNNCKNIVIFLYKCINFNNDSIFYYIGLYFKKPIVVFNLYNNKKIQINKNIKKFKKNKFFFFLKKNFNYINKKKLISKHFIILKLKNNKYGIKKTYNYSKKIIKRILNFDIYTSKKNIEIVNIFDKFEKNLNLDYFQFFKEYSSMWIMEYIRHYTTGINQSILNKNIWNSTYYLNNINNKNIYEIINNFNLSFKIRKYLIKKYPYFIHKKSIFLIIPEKKEFYIKDNYLFFIDYSEFFIKYLSKKLLFGLISLKIGISDKFSFSGNSKKIYNQSEKLKTTLKKLSINFEPTQLFLKNRLRIFKKQSTNYISSFDNKEYDNYGIWNILKNVYRIKKLNLNFYKNIKKNIKFIYPSLNIDQSIKIVTVFLDKDDIFYINDYLKKYNNNFNMESFDKEFGILNNTNITIFNFKKNWYYLQKFKNLKKVLGILTLFKFRENWVKTIYKHTLISTSQLNYILNISQLSLINLISNIYYNVSTKLTIKSFNFMIKNKHKEYNFLFWYSNFYRINKKNKINPFDFKSGYMFKLEVYEEIKNAVFFELTIYKIMYLKKIWNKLKFSKKNLLLFKQNIYWYAEYSTNIIIWKKKLNKKIKWWKYLSFEKSNYLLVLSNIINTFINFNIYNKKFFKLNMKKISSNNSSIIFFENFNISFWNKPLIIDINSNNINSEIYWYYKIYMSFYIFEKIIILLLRGFFSEKNIFLLDKCRDYKYDNYKIGRVDFFSTYLKIFSEITYNKKKNLFFYFILKLLKKTIKKLIKVIKSFYIFEKYHINLIIKNFSKYIIKYCFFKNKINYLIKNYINNFIYKKLELLIKIKESVTLKKVKTIQLVFDIFFEFIKIFFNGIIFDSSDFNLIFINNLEYLKNKNYNFLFKKKLNSVEISYKYFKIIDIVIIKKQLNIKIKNNLIFFYKFFYFLKNKKIITILKKKQLKLSNLKFIKIKYLYYFLNNFLFVKNWIKILNNKTFFFLILNLHILRIFLLNKSYEFENKEFIFSKNIFNTIINNKNYNMFKILYTIKIENYLLSFKNYYIYYKKYFNFILLLTNRLFFKKIKTNFKNFYIFKFFSLLKNIKYFLNNNKNIILKKNIYKEILIKLVKNNLYNLNYIINFIILKYSKFIKFRICLLNNLKFNKIDINIYVLYIKNLFNFKNNKIGIKTKKLELGYINRVIIFKNLKKKKIFEIFNWMFSLDKFISFLLFNFFIIFNTKTKILYKFNLNLLLSLKLIIFFNYFKKRFEKIYFVKFNKFRYSIKHGLMLISKKKKIYLLNIIVPFTRKLKYMLRLGDTFSNLKRNSIWIEKKNFSEMLWVFKIYKRLIKIIDFGFNLKKIKFFKWRLFLKKNLKFKNLKKNNNLNYYEKIKKITKILKNFSYLILIKNNFIYSSIIYLKKWIFKITKIKLLKSDNYKFLDININSKLVSYYISDENKDFLIDIIFYWFSKKNYIEYSKNVYIWLDLLTIRWKEQKLIYIKYKNIIINFVWYPFWKLPIPFNYNDILLFINHNQPLTSEDILYYRDYTKYFVQKLIFFFKLKKINYHYLKIKSINYLLNVVNLKFFNRFSWFNKKKLIIFFKKNKNISMSLKNNNLKFKFEPNINILKNKINSYNKFKNFIFNKNKYYKVFDYKYLDVDITSKENLLNIQDQHWTQIERYETWTDSSNTSLTSITSFESQYYWKKAHYSWLVIDEFMRSYKNIRYNSEVVNKKLNYLKNIDTFGVSFPIPFEYDIRFSIYEDPFDDFIFDNEAFEYRDMDDIYEGSAEFSTTTFDENSFSLNTIDEYDFNVEIGGSYYENRRYVGSHEYDYGYVKNLIKNNKLVDQSLENYKTAQTLTESSDYSEFANNYENYNSNTKFSPIGFMSKAFRNNWETNITKVLKKHKILFLKKKKKLKKKNFLKRKDNVNILNSNSNFFLNKKIQTPKTIFIKSLSKKKKKRNKRLLYKFSKIKKIYPNFLYSKILENYNYKLNLLSNSINDYLTDKYNLKKKITNLKKIANSNICIKKPKFYVKKFFFNKKLKKRDKSSRIFLNKKKLNLNNKNIYKILKKNINYNSEKKIINKSIFNNFKKYKNTKILQNKVKLTYLEHIRYYKLKKKKKSKKKLIIYSKLRNNLKKYYEKKNKIYTGSKYFYKYNENTHSSKNIHIGSKYYELSKNLNNNLAVNFFRSYKNISNIAKTYKPKKQFIKKFIMIKNEKNIKFFPLKFKINLAYKLKKEFNEKPNEFYMKKNIFFKKISNNKNFIKKINKSLYGEISEKGLKRAFRHGGRWYNIVEDFNLSQNRSKQRNFKKKEKTVNRLRNLSENSLLDTNILNRNYLKTDNSGYRSKYLISSYGNNKENLGIYLKRSKYINLHNESFDYEYIYKTIPYFYQGKWSGSDSGQTVFDYKKYKISELNPDYKTFNPIFGIYLLNLTRLRKDILKNNWNYSERLINIENIERKIFLFISDYDNQFFDDKIIIIQNIWLFWLEFFRHLYINRWSLSINYTNTDNYTNSSNINKYPLGFLHDLYWFKFITFSKFIKSRVLLLNSENSFKKNYFFKKLKNRKNFKNILKKYLVKKLIKYYFKYFNYNKYSIVKKQYTIIDNFDYIKFKRNGIEDKFLLKLKKKEITYDKLPNFNSLINYFKINNVIIFSRSISNWRSKKTNGVVGFYKPYTNSIMKNPYTVTPIIADNEAPIKKYLYFLTIKPNETPFDDFGSDSETNMYQSKKYTNEVEINEPFSNLNKKNNIIGLEVTSPINNLENKNNHYFKKLKKKNLESFRNSARKDSNLIYKRNWFFSNHILSDWISTLSYKGSWIKFSDFEVDRKRTISRSNKHGSKYRLNFNTELWWTRTEIPDYNFRRMDGIGYDNNVGLLDSDGEVSHLTKALLNIVNLPESLDIVETALPIFERSLIDPESPALNEDGEFPEFDLNVVYNTEIKKRLNFSENLINSKYFDESENFKKNEKYVINLTKKKIINTEKNIKNGNKNLGFSNNNKFNIQRSYSFRIGDVDWENTDYLAFNLNKEINNLTNSSFLRKKNYKQNSFQNLHFEFNNDFDFDLIDYADVIDSMSVKDVHPLISSTENYFDDLIDQKIDESLEYYSLTGNDYSDLFLNYKNKNNFIKINWNFIDFFGEINTGFLENIQGFDYDLLLHKYSSRYWKTILEVDTSWILSYRNSHPQIQDKIDNLVEYLPIWNYDPSLWEIYGYDYEVTPMIISDDSKLLLNSKILRYDTHLKWLQQKDLLSSSISINSLGWGGSDLVNGFNDILPYDILYGSDDDSDFEMYSEYFFNRNWEDDVDANEQEDSVYDTTLTETEEYPQSGFFKEISVKNQDMLEEKPSPDISDDTAQFDPNEINNTVVTDEALSNFENVDMDLTREEFEKLNQDLYTEDIDNEVTFKDSYSKFLNSHNPNNISNSRIINENSINYSNEYSNYLTLYFKNKKLINRFKLSGIDYPKSTHKSFNTDVLSKKLGYLEHSDILYQTPIGLENNKSRILTENFWKLMYVYFISKYDNKSDDFIKDTDMQIVVSDELSKNYFLNNFLIKNNYIDNWNLYNKIINNFKYTNTNIKGCLLKLNSYLNIRNFISNNIITVLPKIVSNQLSKNIKLNLFLIKNYKLNKKYKFLKKLNSLYINKFFKIIIFNNIFYNHKSKLIFNKQKINLLYKKLILKKKLKNYKYFLYYNNLKIFFNSFLKLFEVKKSNKYKKKPFLKKLNSIILLKNFKNLTILKSKFNELYFIDNNKIYKKDKNTVNFFFNFNKIHIYKNLNYKNNIKNLNYNFYKNSISSSLNKENYQLLKKLILSKKKLQLGFNFKDLKLKNSFLNFKKFKSLGIKNKFKIYFKNFIISKIILKKNNEFIKKLKFNKFIIMGKKSYKLKLKNYIIKYHKNNLKGQVLVKSFKSKINYKKKKSILLFLYKKKIKSNIMLLKKQYFIGNFKNIYNKKYESIFKLQKLKIKNTELKLFINNSQIKKIDNLLISIFSNKINSETNTIDILKKINTNIIEKSNYNDILYNYNYGLINFNLGSKRGGIGDSSHWSSETEYLNEQYRRIYSPLNIKYGLGSLGVKNNRFPFAGEFESQHTDTDLILKSNDTKRVGDFTLYDDYQYSSSMESEFSAELMSDVDENFDDFYDDKYKNEKNLELFSYIDWGFNTDHDMLDSAINFLDTDAFTADILRDPTTESVYLDMIQNEYAAEIREFPEEVIDWTVSDYYSELVDKGEISEIPNSTEESELYSIDSSNSISDYYFGSDEDSELGIETIHISEEMSTDYNDFDLHNGDQNKQKKFEFFNDILKIQELDANVKASTHPENDFFSSFSNISNRISGSFFDYKQNFEIESTQFQKINNSEWGDSTNLELEENSRELESFYKQQKYLDSFRIEPLLDEILVNLNINSNLGIYTNKINFKKKKKIINNFKYYLFLKTKYLKHYRGLMLDLNIEFLMF